MPRTPRPPKPRAPVVTGAPAPSAAATAREREHWTVDVGGDDIAVLDIPGALGRVRTFDIDVRFVVRVPDALRGAWHALEVELDGRRQWSRRIDSSNPGQTDSLDYHCRLEVEPGRAVRVRAVARAQGAVPRQLRIDAEEADA